MNYCLILIYFGLTVTALLTLMFIYPAKPSVCLFEVVASLATSLKAIECATPSVTSYPLPPTFVLNYPLPYHFAPSYS